MLKRLSMRARVAVLVAVVLVLAAGPAWGYWTARRDTPAQRIDLGVLDLVVNDADPLTTFALPNATAMYPGTSTAAVLTVRNAGTLPLSYYAEASATDPLGSALRFTVTAGTVTGSAPNQTCTGAVLAGPLSLGPTTGPLLASDAARRTLAAGASEQLCLQASLPTTAPASLQGTTTALTVVFHGKQVSAP